MSFLPVPTIGKSNDIALQDKKTTKNDNHVPIPAHRHASPSAPWPWVDLEDEVEWEQLRNPAPSIPDHCSHEYASCHNCWRGYPQSRYPNWTASQVKKSKIQDAIRHYNKSDPCILYRVDVDSTGFFSEAESIPSVYGKEEEVWQKLVYEDRPPKLRVRGLFIHNLSGPMLQMLGTKYNIEPFFWSSSLNWIPSRFQADIQSRTGDSLTFTLTFLKFTSEIGFMDGFSSKDSISVSEKLGSQEIDTRAPLVLYSASKPRVLVQDLLSIHLIRNVKGSTIISYHPTMKLPTTSAEFFHTRVRFAGQSVYWQTIFQKSPDPTFIFIVYIWHALYAWDQAMENLYNHICILEGRVMSTTNIQLTHELHVIRAHQLHYISLLEDYVQHVKFIMESSNPMMDDKQRFTDEDREYSKQTMATECNTLMLEIERLKKALQMHQKRLTNVMGLVFSRVNIEDSKYMGELTAANVKDSNAMRQISYLTMLFLPASFAASFFGMNVKELTPNTYGTLGRYFAVAIPLTVLTAWIVTAFQYKDAIPEGSNIFLRLLWPLYLYRTMKARRLELMRKTSGLEAGQSNSPIAVLESLENEDHSFDRKEAFRLNDMHDS